jgi:hypothetical protein
MSLIPSRTRRAAGLELVAAATSASRKLAVRVK